jgi:hypothetical protein
MNKVDEIRNQLASRLEKQSKVASIVAETKPVEKKIVVKQQKLPSANTTIPVKLKEPITGVVKLSVSLYNFDIECLDKIKDFMRTQGVRNLSDSEALRLACRTIQTDTNLMEVYETMLTEDRRRKK